MGHRGVAAGRIAMGKDKHSRSTKTRGPLCELHEAFMMLGDSLFESEAFMSLNGKTAVILLALHRKYRRDTKAFSRGLPEGFVFAWSDCRAFCGEATFRRAIEELIAVGFIEKPLNLQPEKPGCASRYVISEKWRAFRSAAVQEFLRRKDRRIKAKSARLPKPPAPRKEAATWTDYKGQTRSGRIATFRSKGAAR